MYGFENRETAEKLKKLVDPAFEPTAPEQMQWETRGAPQIRAYVAQPVTDIPGAQRLKLQDSDGHVYYRPLLGKGLVYIHERDVDGSAPADWTKVRRYPTRSDPQKRIEPYIRTAYNLCPENIIGDGDGENLNCPDTMLFCVEDIKGDLYIVKVCQWDCFSSSSSEGSSSSGGSSSEGGSGESSSSEGGSSEESGRSAESSSGYCRESADVPFVSSISFEGGILTWSAGFLHFRNGHFCGYETDGGDGSGSDQRRQGGEGRGGRLDLCNLECPSSSSSGSGSSSGSRDGGGSADGSDSWGSEGGGS